MLVLLNKEARLRIVRDRGDVFVDFGPKVGDDWFDLRHALKLVAPTLLCDDEIRLKLGLEDTVTQLLDSHWNCVISLLAEDNFIGTRKSARAFQEKEVANFLKGRGKSIRR